MARQVGPLFFTGTVGDLIFYKLGDNYFMRQKGDYNTKAVQKPGARPLMQLRQGEFGRASTLASEVYWRQLPRKYRGHGVHGDLTQVAVRLLRAGKPEAEVLTLVVPLYLKQLGATQPEEPAAAPVVESQKMKQPVVAKPEAPKPQKPRAACTSLSGWQVTGQGQLQQELPATAVRGKQSKTEMLYYTSQSSGVPYQLATLSYSVRDASG